MARRKKIGRLSVMLHDSSLAMSYEFDRVGQRHQSARFAVRMMSGSSVVHPVADIMFTRPPREQFRCHHRSCVSPGPEGRARPRAGVLR